jgi:hypothetical protein
MATYLVERYAPATAELTDAVARLARLAAEARRAGSPVRYLWSARLAADETWLCLLEAPDPGTVADLNRRAAFPFDRISPVELVHGAVGGADPIEQEDDR